MKRRTLFKALAAAAILGGGAGGVWSFLRRPEFGALPEGARLDSIMASPHYAGGAFHNLIPRPVLSDGSGFVMAFLRSIAARKTDPEPPCPVPAKRAALQEPARAEDALVWLGHSSFFIRQAGRRILIDPVFSASASPLPFSVRAFAGATPYAASDMPGIDCLLISHDHWDHLDYPTLMALKERVGMVVCGLGVGAHLRRWGFSDGMIHEADWDEAVPLGADMRVHVTTACHYSGRTLTRDKTLWAGFLLESPGRKIFFSGDSGYGPHFAALGKRFGGVDLALLDCGQYNERWRYIHMTPEEAARAAEELGAANLIPAHIGKFALAFHPWDEPFRRIAAASRGRAFHLATPVIGEVVPLAPRLPEYPRWWEGLAGNA